MRISIHFVTFIILVSLAVVKALGTSPDIVASQVETVLDKLERLQESVRKLKQEQETLLLNALKAQTTDEMAKLSEHYAEKRPYDAPDMVAGFRKILADSREYWH